MRPTPPRRFAAGLTALTMAAAGLASMPTPAAAATADVTDVTLVWGINGYSQQGIFGPWTYHDLTGHTEQLVGSVSGGTQTEYLVEPFPATSMSVSNPQKTPNAIKFTAGEGELDPDTGEGTIGWDGSYTINAYPAGFGAPDEIYADPELQINADGSGELTMDLTLGEGVDMAGEPVPAQPFGRLPVVTFSPGAIDSSEGRLRITPDYAGVEVDGLTTEQARNCTGDDVWGAWPEAFVSAVAETAIAPHFYSTGCGGLQNNKPALPVDIHLPTTEASAPAIEVSQVEFSTVGSVEVTVTGSGFDPSLVMATRPPLSGSSGGVYVVFGRFADQWRPSTGATGSARVNSDQKWAVLAGDMSTVGGSNAGAVELTPDGTFTAVLTVDKDAVDAVADAHANAENLVNYGIFTYPGGGAVNAEYEHHTPVTFIEPEPATPTLTLTVPGARAGDRPTAQVTLSSDVTPTGQVTWSLDGEPLGSTAVAAGRAQVTLPRLAGGRHTLEATYSGDDAHASATAAGTFTVARASAKASGKVAPKQVRVQTRKAAAAARPKARRVVLDTRTSTGFGLDRKVAVVVRRGGKVVFRLQKKVNAAGRLAFRLPPRVSGGAHRIVVRYPGDTHHAAWRTAAGFRAR
ncbi:Ig-like domain repeat protein [Nocardioides limicola]|uniref:Ig-like domain repeat protein n=1 Tax=Nocardioides limicola TaxID=2803368 RepID=UPI00193BB3F8|nr:Ig-like domain repeat protein [Nocardioides sp. DJM-14]